MNRDEQVIHLVSRSIEHTMALGAAVAQAAAPGDLVALIGELGAGKTQFVRGMAVGLGIPPRKVSSPTFVFLQEYPVDEDDPGSLVLAHVDAYRLHGPDELHTIGWDGDGQELRRGAVLVVEWADRIIDALGDDWLEVRLSHHEQGRAVTLSPHGRWAARIQALRQSLEATSKTTPAPG